MVCCTINMDISEFKKDIKNKNLCNTSTSLPLDLSMKNISLSSKTKKYSIQNNYEQPLDLSVKKI